MGTISYFCKPHGPQPRHYSAWFAKKIESIFCLSSSPSSSDFLLTVCVIKRDPTSTLTISNPTKKQRKGVFSLDKNVFQG